MRNLTNPRLICVKGFLFLLAGALAALCLFLDAPSLRTAMLISIAVWSFARFYYFAFYVITTYVDATYQYKGLYSLARHVRVRRKLRRSSCISRRLLDAGMD